MLTVLVVVAAAAVSGEPCKLELVSSAAGENHVLFRGLSPDGGTLAVGWDRGTRPNIKRGTFLLDLRTGKRTELAQLNNAASFSPSGRFVVAANYPGDPALKTEIVELDQRTGQTRTYASGSSLEWLPSYSSDGRWILFNSTRSGGSDIYRARRDSDVVERITTDRRYEAHASFIDGSKRIIYHRQTEGDNYDIVIRDLKTGAEKVMGATSAEEAYPAMSPDGRWIAFSAVSATGAQPNLYVMKRDGSSRVRLTDGAAKDAYAAWSPDGRWLYFVRFAQGGSTIQRIEMRGGGCAHRRAEFDERVLDETSGR